MTDLRHRFWLYLVVFLLVATLSGGAVLAIRQNRGETVEIQLSTPATTPFTGKVYVSGAVASPGVYPVKDGDTVQAVLSDAGLKPDADTGSVRIYVPQKGETRPPQRIDINRAEGWLLEALPGIGETRAQAIVDYRTKNGSFTRVEDLLKVTGISRTILDKIRDLVTVAE